MAKYENRADGNARVGMMIGRVGGSVYSTQRESRLDVSHIDRDLLMGRIAELRRDVTALQESNLLALEDASAAQYQLDMAEGTVEAAVNGDTAGLIGSLRRLRKPLAGAVDMLAKIADIVAAVKGIR